MKPLLDFFKHHPIRTMTVGFFLAVLLMAALSSGNLAKGQKKELILEHQQPIEQNREYDALRMQAILTDSHENEVDEPILTAPSEENEPKPEKKETRPAPAKRTHPPDEPDPGDLWLTGSRENGMIVYVASEPTASRTTTPIGEGWYIGFIDQPVRSGRPVFIRLLNSRVRIEGVAVGSPDENRIYVDVKNARSGETSTPIIGDVVGPDGFLGLPARCKKRNNLARDIGLALVTIGTSAASGAARDKALSGAINGESYGRLFQYNMAEQTSEVVDAYARQQLFDRLQKLNETVPCTASPSKVRIYVAPEKS